MTKTTGRWVFYEKRGIEFVHVSKRLKTKRDSTCGASKTCEARMRPRGRSSVLPTARPPVAAPKESAQRQSERDGDDQFHPAPNPAQAQKQFACGRERRAVARSAVSADVCSDGFCLRLAMRQGDVRGETLVSFFGLSGLLCHPQGHSKTMGGLRRRRVPLYLPGSLGRTEAGEVVIMRRPQFRME
jgi:hypothetical protein